jgi:hypothetical protein
MKKHQTPFTIISITFILALLCSNSLARQATKRDQSKASASPTANAAQAVAPQATGNPVTGSGTAGRVSKWTGVDGSNSFTLGNSSITDDKFGNVGIGTTLPTAKLTVAGLIQSTIGGLQFPDGTLQTTAGIAANQTLNIRDLDHPARQPFSKEVLIDLTPTNFFAETPLTTVPAGKVLVVEYVSAACYLPAGQFVRGFAIGEAPINSGFSFNHLLLPVKIDTAPADDRIYVVNQLMKYYVTEGKTVSLFAERPTSTGSFSCSGSVSGHFIDLP